MSVVDLLALSLSGPLRAGFPDSSGLASVRDAARHYIALHATDPELSPPVVAKALGWSVRQLQLALREVGQTPSDLIRMQRLEHAQRLLRGTRRELSVTSVAYASGFRSLTTFDAAFKRRFGVAPRELLGRTET